PQLGSVPIRQIFSSSGSVGTVLTRAASEIDNEVRDEFNLSATWQSSRFQAALKLYQRTTSNLQQTRYVFGLPQMDPVLTSNGQMRARGVELQLSYTVSESERSRWNTTLVAHGQRSVLTEQLEVFTSIEGNLGAPGNSDVNIVRLAEGEAVGQFWGPVYTGISANGTPTFADLNNDGDVISDPWTWLDENTDMQVLGSGLPAWELGWSNQWTFGSWSVQAMLRSTLGHSLANLNRFFYETDVSTLRESNNVATELRVPGLTTSQFSSLYVEKANFVKLDNVSVAKRFALGQSKRYLTLSLAGHNLLVWTNYTGPNPEPVLTDSGPATNGEPIGQQVMNFVSPGIDRRYTYRPARMVVLGVCLGL
ncbi:MAG: TonB-dependent receptor, partial [Bacteroidota bacterium]